MPITGLDYVNLVVPNADHAAEAVHNRLGLQAGAARYQLGWGTHSRAIVMPGPYLEIMTDDGPGDGAQGAAKARGLALLAAGGGWKSFGLTVSDIVATWSTIRETGLTLSPPMGQVSHFDDGETYRWWVAGHGEEFRTGRLPNLVEYEGNPYPFHAGDFECGTGIESISRVDVAVEDLDRAIDDFERLIGDSPVTDRAIELSAASASWVLPDNRELRLLAATDSASIVAGHLSRYGPGLFGVELRTQNSGQTQRALLERGVRLTPIRTGEWLISAHDLPPGRLTLRAE